MQSNLARRVSLITDSLPTNPNQLRIKRRQTWLVIQDILGSHRKWPANIRMIFWRKQIPHFSRILLASFVFVNGLNVDILIEFLLLVNRNRTSGQIDEIISLLASFTENPKKYTYYAYSVTNNRYEYISGEVRLYEPKSVRDQMPDQIQDN